ncbi:MAG: TraI [Rhodospirillaceae bacterium]|nr:MAG: TraI [Rhodospirillaceae bacterium]TNC97145.1 MAG: TraI protein [Stygiobacter sp.]
MIAKRIDRKPEIRDDYANLGRYIAAAKEKGEKLDKFWIVNCDAGSDLKDLDTALIEIEATRMIFPFRDDKGHIWAVRGMDGQGRTADLGDTDKNITHVIDPGGDLAREKAAYGGPVIITADCLSASVLHKDTGTPVILVPKADHLPTRAAAIRLHHPKSRIVIATPTRNLHADQAAAVVAGELVVIDGIQAQAKIVADLANKRPVAVDPALASAKNAFEETAVSPSESCDGLLDEKKIAKRIEHRNRCNR